MIKKTKTYWDPILYDNQHDFVSRRATDLVSLLDPKMGEHILDLGCGTGILSNEIAKSHACVMGIDSSEDMIHTAKKNYPLLKFEVMDGHCFNFDQLFDAVFSNAALHWMKKPSDVIACVWNSLKPKGRFVLEMGGIGNVHHVLRSIEQARTDFQITGRSLTNYYPSIGEYSGLLESQGFKVKTASLFDRPTCLDGEEGLRNWVRMFRGSVLQQLHPNQHEAFLQRIETIAEPYLFHENAWWADYVRLRITAIKPE